MATDGAAAAAAAAALHAAHLPRLQPALEAHIPAAWQEDWRQVKSALARGDNSSHLVVEMPDTPWGWAYHDFVRARNDDNDMPVMVSSVEQWPAKRITEFNWALIRTGMPCHWTRVFGQA
jgi:hypothetical protein